MNNEWLRERLYIEATALCDSLNKDFNEADLNFSRNDGYYAILTPFQASSSLELWLDYSACHNVPIFWCGLAFDHKRDLEKFVSALSLPENKIERVDTISAPLRPDQMDSHIVETPDKNSNYIGCYFSIYTVDLALKYLDKLLPTGQTQIAFREGDPYIYTGTRYERSHEARRHCIDRNGLSCCVCNMTFSKVYGAIGDGYIHVHHLVQLADPNHPNMTSPDQLVCVCPNCHAMLHAKYLKTPADLKEMMHLASTDGAAKRTRTSTGLPTSTSS